MQNVLRIARFEDGSVRSRAIGAGIVPVARRPDGSLVLLLAREQHISNWKGSCKWSGFEGGRKQDESIEDTACREWREESLNIVDGVEEALRSGSYVCRYTLNILQNRPQLARCIDSDRYHVTYVVEVPYLNEYIDAFERKRATMIAAQTAIATWQMCCRQLTCEPILDMELDRDAECCLHLSSTTICSSSPHGDLMLQLVAAHARLSVALENLQDHECKHVHYSPTGIILDASINRDFLEKECIAWWSLSDARSVLKNGGRFNDQSFRTYFLPVLLGIVSHLEQFESTGTVP
jgi:hypothetical protein